MKKIFKVMLLAVVVITTSKSQAQTLKPVFDSYFNLKDALVQSDEKKASEKASLLLSSLSKIEMNALGEKEHQVWMKSNKELLKIVGFIAKSNDITDQREEFAKLSVRMHELAKVSNLGTTFYYQRCPMYKNGKGGTWLSLESTIKNPFYGSQMLNCGKTIETLK